MNQTRPLRDRLGEAIRAARHGPIRPLWADMAEVFREAYRLQADQLLITARNRGITIEDANRENEAA